MKTKEPVKKSEGFLLVLILLVFFLVHDHEEYPKKVDSFANHIYGHIESIERQNRVLFKTVEALLKDSKNNELLEEICTSIIEDEVNPIYIAKGYDCLAKIYSEKHDQISIFQAIKNQSYALDSFYDPQYLQNLFKYIIQGYHVDISSNDELEVLENLSNSKNNDIKARALYRLSLINSLGRKSSLEDYTYDLEKAKNLRNQVTGTINFNNKKYIDVLFSLNNNPKYIQYAKATIASILLNSDLDSEYRFYVLSDSQDPLSEINQKQLLSLQSISPYTIKFTTFPMKTFVNKDYFKDIKTRLLFSRFLSENIFPELDSIISLDVDTIVLRDLYNLQQQRYLNNYILMGAIEGQKTKDHSLCNFPYAYVNFGVIVENLNTMRNIKSSKLILDEYQNFVENKDKRCSFSLEQDVINSLYTNQIGYISKRWNYIPSLNSPTKFMPFIIHYAGEKYGFYNEQSYKALKLLRDKYQEFAYNTSLEE